jgi:hypothetical protein
MPEPLNYRRNEPLEDEPSGSRVPFAIFLIMMGLVAAFIVFLEVFVK